MWANINSFAIFEDTKRDFDDMQRFFFRYFLMPFYRRYALRAAKSAQRWRYGALVFDIPVGVFHPGLYFSTPIFLDFLMQIDFKGMEVLEIGTGSGAPAIAAARNGARATALDINPQAVAAARRNAGRNGVALRVVESNLLEALTPQIFDCILINPPFYPRNPANMAEHAFFAGENLAYFVELFRQLPEYCSRETRVWIILSEDCDVERIFSIAMEKGFVASRVQERRKWGERFYIYALKRAG